MLCQPADQPRLEELVATLGKVAGALAADDPLGVRLAAADLARLCPCVLRPANPGVRVASRRTAFAAALDLPVAPPGYRDDMLLCLGVRPATAVEVGAAAARLVTGVLPLVRPYADRIAETAGPDLALALRDGRLDRYVAQLSRAVGDGAQVPAPRAGQSVTVPVPDSAPSDGGPAAAARPSRLDPAIAARLQAATPHGLVAAVVQQHDTGEVLMLAWMDDEALHRTLTTGRATYWSRSRQEYWVKGETSGHHQWVRSVRAGLRRRRAAGARRPGGRRLPHRRAHLLPPSCPVAAQRERPVTDGVAQPDARPSSRGRRPPGGAGDPPAAGRRRDPGRASTASWPAPAGHLPAGVGRAGRSAAWPGRGTRFVGVRSTATLTERDGEAHVAGHPAGRRADLPATRCACCGRPSRRSPARPRDPEPACRR